ncbi:MAG: division/cell wall cluster transcriptional repressor MraZ [Chloroflexota bacterium]|nr:division/cell wall cluster transcriptional repressor MraZ [Chloroflexota bacterium]
MFLGEYEYKIDPKGRIAIPPRFRGEFWEGIVLARGFDGCIAAYPPPVWQEIADRFGTLPFTRSKSRRISRAIFSTAFSLELDEQGRVMLPAPLRQYAAIGDSAVVAGVNNYLEIWGKERWQQETELIGEQAWQIAEGMEMDRE